MLNVSIIQGRIVKDPELRNTSGGKSMTSFAIACERDFKDKDTGKRLTDFFNVMAFNSTADFICNYLKQGDTIIAEGRLSTGSYTDKEGIKRNSVTLIVEQVNTTSSRRKHSGEDDFSELTDDDEGLPF